MRRNLLLLLAAIAAVLVFLALSRERTPQTAGELPVAEASPPSEAPLELLVAEAPRPQEPPRNGNGSLAPVDDGKSANAPPDLIHIHGTVVVIDANDRQYPRESGHFTLVLWPAQAAPIWYPVVVEDGSWSVVVGGTNRFEAMSVRSFELGRRTAIAATGPEERLRIPRDGRQDLQVRWPPRLTLHVQLPDGVGAKPWFSLYEPEPDARAGFEHPGRVLSISSSSSSTLYLNGPAEGSRSVYVNSRGYAWQRIEVLAEEYERTVTLERGGDLEVKVEGFERNQDMHLRLFSRATGKEVPLLEIAPGLENPCRIESLPLGWLEVRAYVGDPRSPDLHGSVETEIRDGQTSAVTLYLNSR